MVAHEVNCRKGKARYRDDTDENGGYLTPRMHEANGVNVLPFELLPSFFYVGHLVNLVHHGL